MRVTLFPIQNIQAYEFYNKHMEGIWTSKDINYNSEYDSYKNNLSADEQKLVQYILAFFTSSDRLVNENIEEYFSQQFDELEINMFYNTQKMIEDVHNVVYNTILDNIIVDKDKKNMLFNSIETMPVIKSIADFINDIPNKTLGVSLIRTTCVEGIFFTGVFCIIYWFSNGRNVMSALVKSNEWIARDEALHTEFSIYLYKYHLYKTGAIVDAGTCAGIIREAVDISCNFLREALPNNIKDLTYDRLENYVKAQADTISELLGYKKIYNAVHDFEFMNRINMNNKTNFLEKKVSEYKKSEDVSANKDYIDLDF